MKQALTDFITKLAKIEMILPGSNQYSFGDSNNQIRRDNLLLYLMQMYQRNPEVLLVGEAPGYQGCRLTGVPFVSEYIILQGLANGLFGINNGYQKTTEYQKVWKEPSATIVWQALEKLPDPPLIWSSFPYHPHKLNNPLSNRTPSLKELELGRPFLEEIIKLFKIKKIIAVGNKAQQTLQVMGIDSPKIRHPANGGKNDFVAGINQYLT